MLLLHKRIFSILLDARAFGEQDDGEVLLFEASTPAS
jgi:hypothetical protein